MPWQLQEAKQNFSQVVQRALDEGPQVVTRHGKSGNPNVRAWLASVRGADLYLSVLVVA